MGEEEEEEEGDESGSWEEEEEEEGDESASWEEEGEEGEVEEFEEQEGKGKNDLEKKLSKADKEDEWESYDESILSDRSASIHLRPCFLFVTLLATMAPAVAIYLT